jgi:putative two-component system response regulator
MKQNTQKEISILIVDDDEQIRRMLQQVCQRNGYACFTASNGKEALQTLERKQADVMITDIAMPKMDGIKLTERIRELYDFDVILMTGYVKDFTYGDAIAKGANDFIQKPLDIEELLIRLKRVLRERAMRAELKKSFQQSLEALEGVVRALSSTIEARDPYTSGHQRRVVDLACAIAENMGLPEDQITGIRMAGVIHDLGKIAVPAEILNKASQLSEMEFNIIKTHPQMGYDILKEINFPWPIAEIVYQHHERMDGSGYPRGIKGDDILLEARIIAVADVLEAMASHRPYRPSFGIDVILEEISNNSGRFYDPEIVESCIKLFKEKGFKL